jgi:hypothetical protein
LSRAHRTLPLQEQRSAVSTKVKSKLRYPLRLRRKHKQIESTPLPASSHPYGSTSELHRSTSTDSSTSSTSSASVRDELAEAVNLLDPSAEFTAEPDEESEPDSHDDRPGRSETTQTSPRSEKSLTRKVVSYLFQCLSSTSLASSYVYFPHAGIRKFFHPSICLLINLAPSYHERNFSSRAFVPVPSSPFQRSSRPKYV